ncbi:MAG TPA: hypothetical protein VMG10_13965, partial [Gemmataceae bacterium]|nr:hypothetical protein [Gemmataceae bacterium]
LRVRGISMMYICSQIGNSNCRWRPQDVAVDPESDVSPGGNYSCRPSHVEVRTRDGMLGQVQHSALALVRRKLFRVEV